MHHAECLVHHAERLLTPCLAATSFNRSLSGMSSFLSSTNLLGLFPQGMYSVAQVGCAGAR